MVSKRLVEFASAGRIEDFVRVEVKIAADLADRFLQFQARLNKAAHEDLPKAKCCGSDEEGRRRGQHDLEECHGHKGAGFFGF